MQAFLVILALAALALIAASPKRFRPTRSRSAVNTFIAVWGSVILGAILGPTVTGVIPTEPLDFAKPLAVLGLGWIGVMVGAQARRRLLQRVPMRIWAIVGADLLITGVCFALLAWAGLRLWLGASPASLADAALIGAASLGWAMETRSARIASSHEALRLAIAVRASGGLLAIGAIIAVGVVSVATSAATPRMTAIAIATLAVVAVTAALLLKFAISMAAGRRGDQLAVFLGAVGLAAGTAGQIGLSPLFAALLTGIAIANMPGMGLRSFEAFILRAEHVVAALFGLLAGVFIDIRIGATGLAFALALTAARLLLKPATLMLAIRATPAGADPLPESSPLYLAPIRVSPVAIALAVSLVLLDPTPTHHRILTIVVLTGVLSEFCSLALTGMAARRLRTPEPAVA